MQYRAYSSLPLGVENKNLALIDTRALAHNFRTLARKAASNGARTIAVVKADAYGHGLPICVPALLREGCDFFAVASLSEAIAVRKILNESNSFARILIFGYTDPADFPLLFEHHLIQSVFSEAYGNLLADAAEAAKSFACVHIAADTGMHRVGFDATCERGIEETCCAVKRLSLRFSLRIDGLYSHLACADALHDARSVELTKRQIDRFEQLWNGMNLHKIRIPMRHLCNSAGLFFYPEAAFDAVRLGISLYGGFPEANDNSLLPVMRLESRVVHLHTLLPGESLGYGADFCAATPRLIATLPIGYADGLLRACTGASVRLYTKSGAHSVRVVGRVCMDQCMLDVTDTDAALGDRVVLFGDLASNLSSLSRHAKTIPYEILTSVSARVERIEG